jgi:hypothetical protein
MFEGINPSKEEKVTIERKKFGTQLPRAYHKTKNKSFTEKYNYY